MAWSIQYGPYCTENSMSWTGNSYSYSIYLVFYILVILSSMFELNLDMAHIIWAQHSMKWLTCLLVDSSNTITELQYEYSECSTHKFDRLHCIKMTSQNKAWKKKECLLHGCVLKYIETGKWLFRSDLNSINFALLSMKKPFSCYGQWFWLFDFRQFLFDQTNFVF